MKLYRYSRLDQRLVQYLLDRQLYFQSPLNFNDPYDCDLDCLRLENDPGHDAKFAALITSLRAAAESEHGKACRELDRYLEGEGPHERGVPHLERIAARAQLFRAKQAALESALAVAEGWNGAPGTVEESWNSFRRFVVSSFGVVCFSAWSTHMLLWSHYGDGHRGVALEYDTEERPVPGWKHYEYLAVQYSMAREIDVLAEGYPRAFTRLLTTKGMDWSYEKEYRLVSLRGPGFQPNRMANLTGIVLGAKFLDNSRDLAAAFWEALGRLDERRRTVRKLQLGYCVKVPSSFTLDYRSLRSIQQLGAFLGL